MTYHPTDIHVGYRIRHRRWLVGMTQQQLAETCGVKFQQIQKYESGANRVSASRLWQIAQALDVPVNYFFEGLDGAPKANGATEPSKEDFHLVRLLNHLRRNYPDTCTQLERLVGVLVGEV